MSRMPRILPLIGIAIVGVLAINALAGARDLSGLVSGARAFAEEAAKTVKPVKGKKKAANPDGVGGEDPGAKSQDEAAATGEATNASALGLPPTPAKPPPGVCAPTAAELAKEAGLSPAELQVLQNLGERRGELDQRESDLDTQLALMATAEAKLDAKVKVLSGLKGDIQGLLTQADTKQDAEIDRLVKVFEGMKPKDAAPRMVLLDDSVRIPIAAKMKDRALSAILSNMPPAEAKKVTEALAKRFTPAQQLAANMAAIGDKAAAGVSDPNRTAAADLGPDGKPLPKKKAGAHKKKPAKKAAPKTDDPDADTPVNAAG